MVIHISVRGISNVLLTLRPTFLRRPNTVRRCLRNAISAHHSIRFIELIHRHLIQHLAKSLLFVFMQPDLLSGLLVLLLGSSYQKTHNSIGSNPISID